MIASGARPAQSELFSRTVGLVHARIALVSNDPRLVSDSRYFDDPVMESLVTDYRRVEALSADVTAEARILVLDHGFAPGTVGADEYGVTAVGSFSEWEAVARDRRYTLFGNQGLLYRFALRVLEEWHGISSFHANAVYSAQRNELLIAMGGANSGKSPVLLAAIVNGYEVFATELVHVRVRAGRVEFFKGAVIDNIRAGNILFDFPELLDRFQVPNGFEDPWETKIAVDFGPWEAGPDVITPDRIRIIVPKVEPGRPTPVRLPLSGAGLVKALFENASEKIGSSFTMYDTLASCGFDTPLLAAKRLRQMHDLVETGLIVDAESIIAAPRAFLEITS